MPDASRREILLVLEVGASCFIVILAQSAATSWAYALRYGDSFSEDVDLVGLSLANLATACSGTFVVNGSQTKEAIVETAGSRSQVSHLTTTTMGLVVLLFLTKPVGHLRNAVLSAIVFLVGVRLINYRGLAEIRKRARKSSFWRWSPRLPSYSSV